MSRVTYSEEHDFILPKVNDHVWNYPVMNDYTIAGIAGSGEIGEVSCRKCNYTMKIHYGFLNNDERIRIMFKFLYDSDETCSSFKMKNALE